jgi:hypothetical protein
MALPFVLHSIPNSFGPIKGGSSPGKTVLLFNEYNNGFFALLAMSRYHRSYGAEYTGNEADNVPDVVSVAVPVHFSKPFLESC